MGSYEESISLASDPSKTSIILFYIIIIIIVLLTVRKIKT